jgi:myotubularin-related protein 6/7/8
VLLKRFFTVEEASPKFDAIIDLRTKANASKAKDRGGGTEIESNYPNSKVFNTNIESVQVLSEYHTRFIEAVRVEDLQVQNYLNDAQNYLKFIQSLLRPATFITKFITVDGISCLVHGDDGRDFTCIVVSLAKLQIDRYYRTMNGFIDLILEDWCSTGFRFSDRCGPINSKFREQGSIESPIFTIFIDCVWQILNQFPRAFEFIEDFLWFIHDASYSSLYAEFLCNSEKDRIGLSQKYSTIRSYLSKHYLNSRLNDSGVIQVNAASKLIKYCSKLYEPWNRKF